MDYGRVVLYCLSLPARLGMGFQYCHREAVDTYAVGVLPVRPQHSTHCCAFFGYSKEAALIQFVVSGLGPFTELFWHPFHIIFEGDLLGR
jgi:hypothetical protein